MKFISPSASVSPSPSISFSISPSCSDCYDESSPSVGDFVDEFWDCDFCMSMNLHENLECRKCGAPKGWK